jgi:hypothetical protein
MSPQFSGSQLTLRRRPHSLFMPAEKTKLASPARYDDWEAVRREFDLAPDYILLGLFYLTSHPRPVGEAIEQYRRKLDANPFVTG